MKQPELKKFAEQLAIWTELIIDNGRTPFRRVDLYPEIQTDQGPLQPPLVFWINRQSMMAGGVLLLPDRELESELEQGRSCCAALGLKHFVTWESDQVRIWQIDTERIVQHQRFELKQNDHPDAFRHLLAELLETLKMLAVIGLVPNDQLSAHYFQNLFLTTLDLSLPAQINSYRNLRAEQGALATGDADLLAREASRLLLLQLLGLAWHQKLPSAILPEKLERAIQLSLPLLPEPLRSNLSAAATTHPPELAYETAVCFHHLLLRLRQLSWRQYEQRAIASIRLLIDHWGGRQATAADIVLYPQAPVLNERIKAVISDSPSLLAATALLEDLLLQSPKMLQLGNLFQLNLPAVQGYSVAGTLTDSRLPTREERQQFTALLRTSWPSRRFKIGNEKPLWFWELIHLLGLGKQLEKLNLRLPIEALQSPAEEALWPLLVEDYTPVRLDLDEEQILLELLPGALLQERLQILYRQEKRYVPISNQPALFRSQVLLALLLPPEIYQLLGDKLLWPDQESPSDAQPDDLRLFAKSSLGLLLEELTGISLQSLTDAELQLQFATLPRPDNLTLRELGHGVSNSLENLNRLLAELLEEPTLVAIEIPEKSSPALAATPKRADRLLRDEIAQQLQNSGIPNFPDQYLYFLEQAETTSYQLDLPLTVTSELLGAIELEDAAGQKIQVYGEELANALLLCSELGKQEIELPTDREQLATLLKQYWKDMRQLNKQLNSICHSRLKSSKDADRLVKKVWKKLQLPKLP